MGCERLVLLFSHLVELKAVGICKNRNCSNSNNQLSRNSVNLLKKLKKTKLERQELGCSEIWREEIINIMAKRLIYSFLFCSRL